MSILAIYSSPATPGNAAWSVDVTGAIRLGSITGLGGEARLGATGNGNVVLDDPTSSIGHSSDGIVGLKQFSVNELSCPIGNQRVWTGYVADRTYRRGEDQTSSLRTGTARKIDVTLVDLNDFLSFRVFAPVAIDPTSSFVRGAETDLERVQGLLADVDFISDTLYDVGYIPSTGGVSMDANDYTGQRPADVLNDCAQVSGRNFFVLYDEATNHYALWYDVWTTTGSTTRTYDSALQLTNVLSEVDNSTTFAGIDAQETLDPSRLVSGVYLPYDGGTAYDTDVTTSYTYAWRDTVMPSNSFIKSSAKADALITRYLSDNSTEDPTIRVSVQLPNAKVTGIHEGMRLKVHFTHLPLVNSTFTWTRVLSRTIRVDVETQLYYWLDLELSPTAPTGDYMMSFLTQRSDTSYGAAIVPRGTDDGGMSYSDPFIYLGGCLIYPQTPLTGYPMDVAYLTTGPTHTQWIWGGVPGLNGTARPTGFHLILGGATGPPVYLGDYPTTGGYTPSLPEQYSPSCTAPDDGIMFCLTEGMRAGDVGLGNWTVVGPSGTVTLRQTMASDIVLGDPGGDTYPNVILVYKVVTAGQTVQFHFHDTGTKQYVNSLVVFVPGADLTIDEFTHSGSTGGFLAWSW